jgi:putative MATE family efflux protein
MTKNLTEGNPFKLILSFAFPLFLGNLFQQAYNMADAAIVGRCLGSFCLAGVGASSSVQFLVLGFCMGVSAGFTIPVAQRFGADDFSEMRKYVFIAVVFLAVFSAVAAALCAFFCREILSLLKTPADIFSYAYDYLFVLFLGIPFSLFYNTLSGFLRAAGDSSTPFFFLLISIVLNIALDFVFILSLKLGVPGASLATVLSQGISSVLCLLYIIFRVKILLPQKDDLHWNWKKCGILLSMGIPMGLQFSITAIGSMVLQAANNSLGAVYVSAFTAVTKIKQLMMSPYDAVGTAVSTFASQNFGAHKFSRIRRGIVQGLVLSVSYGIFASLVQVFWGRYISLMFIKSAETEILDAVAYFTKIAGSLFWFLGFLNIIRPTVQGLGFTRRAIFSGVIEMFARCAVVFGLVSRLKFTAVCMADPAAWACATVYMIFTLNFCLKKIEGSAE